MTSACGCAPTTLCSPPLFIRLHQLFEAEMRCAITEAEAREEVMEEMEERMRNMEKMYLKRITDEVEMNERKMDAKIDMLHQTGLLGSGRASEEEEYVSYTPRCFITAPAHRAVE